MSGRWIESRLPFDAAVAVIEARDALRAIVTTSEGGRFTTADGGRTWSPMP